MDKQQDIVRTHSKSLDKPIHIFIFSRAQNETSQMELIAMNLVYLRHRRSLAILTQLINEQSMLIRIPHREAIRNYADCVRNHGWRIPKENKLTEQYIQIFIAVFCILSNKRLSYNSVLSCTTCFRKKVHLDQTDRTVVNRCFCLVSWKFLHVSESWTHNSTSSLFRCFIAYIIILVLTICCPFFFLGDSDNGILVHAVVALKFVWKKLVYDLNIFRGLSELKATFSGVNSRVWNFKDTTNCTSYTVVTFPLEESGNLFAIWVM